MPAPFTLLVAATVATAPAAPDAPDVRTYALVVGVNAPGDPSRPVLRYADDDAARFYELLRPIATEAFLLTGFDGESQAIFRPLLPAAAPPTLAKLQGAVNTLRDRIAADRAAGRRTQVYFYYAGHGELEGDEGTVRLDDGRLTRTMLRNDVLAALGADRLHVIVDACKSIFLVAGRGPGGVAQAPYHLPFGFFERLPEAGYVLSTSTDGDAHEWERWRGGVFSHEVRSALVGGADADGDGRVDYDELGAFVATANETIPAEPFRPRVFVRAPAGDARAVLFAPSALAASGTALTLAPEVAGRLWIGDERGLRYADLHKAAGTHVRLALLAPRRYEIAWGALRYAAEARDPGGEVALLALTGAPAPTTPRGEAHRAFEAIFDAPFSPDVVRGYRLRTGPMTAAMAPPGEDWRPPWIAGLAAGSVVSLLASVALLVTAIGVQNKALHVSQVRRAELDRRERALTIGWLTTFGVGLGTGAATVGLALTEP